MNTMSEAVEGNKIFRVTFEDLDKVTYKFTTCAWTCDHACTNTYDAFGMDIRIKIVEVI